MYVVVFNDSRLNWFESTLIVPCFSTMWQTKGKTLTLFWKTILSTCKQLKKIHIFLMKSKKLKKKFTSLVFSARDSCSWWICCEYSSTYNIRVSNLNKINFFLWSNIFVVIIATVGWQSMCHYTSSTSKSTIIQMKSLYMYCTLYVPHGAEKDIMITLYIVYQYRCTEMMLCFILVVTTLFWSRKKISLIGLRLLCLSQLHT